MHDDNIEAWIISQVAGYLGRSAEEIDTLKTLGELGLGSVQVLAMCGEAEDFFQIIVDPDLFLDDPTLADLGVALTRLIRDGGQK